MAVTVLAAIAQTVIQGGGWAMFFKTLAVTAGLSAVSRALTPKVDGSMLKGTNVTSREPTASRKIVYGRSRVGGTVAYIETNNNGSGSANEYLHLVIALAGHEIDAYEEVYFNEKKIWDNGSYLLTWGDYVHIGFHKGDQTTADADLVASSNKWTNDHVLNGTAYLYVRLKYDAEQFAQGLPNISAVIRGKKVYNPTTDVTEWSQNPALCIRDYLLDSRYGLAESASNINATALASAQSICDQSVLLDSGASHPRYVLDGVVDTSESRKNNIEAMLSAMGGKLIYSGGQYFVSAAAYSAPTVSIDESVLSGTISVQTKQSRRTLYNGVKGVFVSEEDNYIVADYPSITSSAYSAEDGEPIFLDMVLPFTTNNIRAQRLAKLALLQSRQQTSITLPCNLAALKFKAGDNISVSNTRLGYTNKVFEVIGYDMTLADDGSIVVEVNAIETDSSIYDWTTSDEQEFVTGGEVDVYSGETVAPTNVVANAEQYVNGMGVPTPQIGVTFTASDDAFIDHYIVSWKATSQTEYRSLSTVEPRATIQGIKSGNTYNVNVKAVNQFGIPSPEVAASNVAIPSTASSDVIMYAGNENAQGSNFYVDATGHAHAKDITIYSDTGAVFFSSATGFTDEALTQISTVTGTSVTTLSNSLLDDADVETIILVAETDLTIKAKLNSAFFGSSTVSGADALADIPENFTVKILYKEQSAPSYTQLASQTYTRTTGTPTATQYQAQTSVFDVGSEVNAYSYITRSLGSVDADGFSILTATLNDLAGAGTGTTYLFKTEVSTTDTSYNTNDNHVDSNADRIISITSGGTGFYVENGTGSQGVPEGDITAVIAGTNLTGGGTSGDVTLSLSSTISGNHTFSNNLTVSGDLTVNGTTTALNTANLDVEDKNITLNYGAGDTSASANGAGITIQDAVNSTTDATILWDATNDEFDFSHDVTAPNLSVTNWNTAYSYSQVGHLPLSGGTLTGDVSINKISPQITLYDTNGNPSSYPRINFKTANNQGVSLYHTEFDSELPVAGYGLVLDADSTNAQYPTTGTLSLVVKGEIFTGSTSLGSTNKVWHEGSLTTVNKANYDTAYSWGDHATAGYAVGSFLPLSGGTLTGNVSFGDNVKATFGAGSDLQIFHNGTDSFIREVGTGGLKIDSNGPDLTLRVNATESAIVANSNGSVDLYYDNTLKLATTATGIDVTGNVIADAVGIGTSSPTAKLTVSGTGVGAAIDWTNTTASTGRSYRWVSLNNGTGFAIEDLTAGSERMRIDSAGNLLVGTTTTTFSDKGVRLYNYGNIEVVRPNDSCMELNRTGSDGIIARFHKDGTTVGSIGCSAGTSRLFIGGGDTGVRFAGDLDTIVPWNTNNTLRDAAIDLGEATGRFKDLYLSGMVSSYSVKANIFYDSGNTANYLDSPTSSVFRLNGSTAVNLAVGGATKLVANASGIDITGALYVPEYIYHQSNTGTYIRYLTDRIITRAGSGAQHDMHSNGNQYFIGKSIFYTGVDINAGNLEMGATTVIDSSRNLTNIGNITSTADNSFLSMGVAGAGSAVGGRYLSIEGNTDTSGEGSGRIFFTEHNSTTASMDNYGMSIGYRGGADIVQGASGNTWDGLSQIGNGEWGMWGHNNSASGSLIMYGDRAASFINFAGNGLDGVGRVRFSDTSPTLQEDGNYLRIQTASGWTSIGSGNSSWTHFFTDRGGFYFGTRINVNGEIRVYNTSSVINSAGAYAPTFYDSDNTAYYVNPASTGTCFNGAGNIITAGNVTAYSDRKLKENISPITNALAKVQQLNGVTYNRNDLGNTEKRYAGLIAQDVKSVLPEAVEGSSTLRVDYSATIGLLVESIKELKSEVDDLKKQLAQKSQ